MRTCMLHGSGIWPAKQENELRTRMYGDPNWHQLHNHNHNLILTIGPVWAPEL